MKIKVQGLGENTTHFPTPKPPTHSTTELAVQQLQKFIDATHLQWPYRQREPLLQAILASVTNLGNLFSYTTEWFVGRGRVDCAIHKSNELKTLVELKVGDPECGINQLATYLASANLDKIKATQNGVKAKGLIIGMEPVMRKLYAKGELTVLLLEYNFNMNELPSVTVIKSRIFGLWTEGVVNFDEVNLFVDWLQISNQFWFHGEPYTEEDEASVC